MSEVRLPCETVARYVLPVFRSYLSKELIEKYGYTQVETARKLGTTQAAISYYLHLKRGEDFVKELESMPLVKSAAIELAQNLANGEPSIIDVTMSFCKVCMTLKEKDILGASHEEEPQIAKR